MNKPLYSIALTTVLLSTQVNAHSYGYNCGGGGFGAAFGAGILGGMIGQALIQPSPQVIIVPVPTPYVQPYTVPLPGPSTLPMYQQRYWWCRASERWYPDVVTCATPWSR